MKFIQSSNNLSLNIRICILYHTEMFSASKRTMSIKRPSGIIAGLTAAWAIFGLFLAVDSQLSVPPGYFL